MFQHFTGCFFVFNFWYNFVLQNFSEAALPGAQGRCGPAGAQNGPWRRALLGLRQTKLLVFVSDLLSFFSQALVVFGFVFDKLLRSQQVWEKRILHFEQSSRFPTFLVGDLPTILSAGYLTTVRLRVRKHPARGDPQKDWLIFAVFPWDEKTWKNTVFGMKNWNHHVV